MPMNDLISRSALHAAICLNAKYGTYGEFTDGSEVCFTSKEVHSMIDEAPAVDAVEVVRCKDCIYNKHRTEGKHILNWCGKFENVMRDNDFCSFGEKPAYERRADE